MKGIDGQISIFDELIQNPKDKPFIGTKVLFYYKGQFYPAIVTAHCGYDFFYIKFTGKKPHEGNLGWHVSMRGYKKDWDYMEV